MKTIIPLGQKIFLIFLIAFVVWGCITGARLYGEARPYENPETGETEYIISEEDLQAAITAAETANRLEKVTENLRKDLLKEKKKNAILWGITGGVVTGTLTFILLNLFGGK